MIKSSSVLIVEPESSGIDLIEAARSLGTTVYVIDRRLLEEMPSEVRRAVDAGAAVHIQAETRLAQAVVAVAEELATKTELIAVVPGFEYAVPAAAAVAEKLRMPGVGTDAAERMRDKSQMKQRLSAARVPVAPGIAIDAATCDETMLSEIVQRVGFPAVVKPVDGSGSLWVRRVDDLHELRDYLSRAGAGPLDDMGQRVGDRLLVESYIEGPEFSIEGYATSSHIEVVAVTEKCLGPEPYFVEVCHVVDADLSTDHRTSLERTAVAAVRALGMGSGVFHLEARLTPSGPVVMEVAARLGGDRIHKLVSAVHGQDLPEIMIRCLAGLPILPPVIEGLTRVAAAKFFTVSGPSRVADPGLLARRLLDLDGCVELAMACQPGASLQPAVDFRQRFGHIVITAPDRDRLRKTLDEVDRLIIDALGGSC